MDFKVIEDKWQKFWESSDLYRADDGGEKKKKYILVEFPYPSGSGLHVGHAFSFTGSDVYARFKRMQGYNVLFPMGWDAFGLPTENYAIKTKRKPQEVTKENTDMFRKQMKRLAYSFDWSREINTTDPKYYKWTQWIFIELFKKGLAYKKEMPINWCPACKIGLANEEVVDGKCERCGAEVERRTISQWVVKITEYADKLIAGLKETKFVEKVKQAQINWIGKSDGAKIRFQISDPRSQIRELEVFTTRPDTLPGVTFMVISPEHELSLELGKNDVDISNYQRLAKGKSDLERTELNKEKTGVFSGLYAINPYNDKKIPIWISDFVLASYGTGAIMAVPAHDERDYAFAKRFSLPIIPVIKRENWNFDEKAYTEVEKDENFEKMLNWVEEKRVGKRGASYHLRDWIFSRQHYWGEPIPMIKCPKCGWVPVPEDQLPIVLPEVEAYEPSDDGRSPLSKIEGFVNCQCPKCGGKAERETDTMPNWAGSDWYFLRYIDPFNDTVLSSIEKMQKWLPVDIYVGGDEHNTLHLLYSRFIYLFLRDIGAVPQEIVEPYFRRMSHGVILGPDNQRMSKSKGNVIVPETVADKYGVDVLRLYLMFMGPFTGTMAWNEKTLMGVKRFLDRFCDLVERLDKEVKLSNSTVPNEDEYPEVLVKLNKTIDKVTRDVEQFGYNTAIASLMELLNEIGNIRINEGTIPLETGHRWLLVLSRNSIKKIVKILAPFAPYSAEELWSQIYKRENSLDTIDDSYKSVHQSEWPEAEEKYLVSDMIKLPVAVNGKLREVIEVESEKINDKEYIMSLVLKSDKVQTWLNGKVIIKEILVPGKMLNLVIN